LQHHGGADRRRRSRLRRARIWPMMCDFTRAFRRHQLQSLC
jgi:hypothetical protein